MAIVLLIGLVAAWIVLPLIPAVITFRLFPDTSVTTSGPLARLKVNASGAFAAYLVVFVACTYLIAYGKTLIEAGRQAPQFWTVNAQFKLVDAAGINVTSDSIAEKLTIRLRPAPVEIDSLIATLKVFEQNGELPKLIVDIPGFGKKRLYLSQLRSTRPVDTERKIIDLTNPPIEIQQTSYGDAQQFSASTRRNQ